jgi:hypothetical protein
MEDVSAMAVMISSLKTIHHRVTETQRKPYSTLRIIPCVRSELLKLMSSPTLLPESFRYGFMNWQNPLDGFQFQDHFIADDQIDLVSAIELQTLIRDREIDLTLEGQPAKGEFMAPALFISGFQQSGPS